MRWTIIRLIWHRELRDLLRDRRWLLMLLGLPVLIYPVFGLLGLAFALSMLDQKTVIGVCGAQYLPQPVRGAPLGPTAELSWLAVLPALGASPADVAAAAAGVIVRRQHMTVPPLLTGDRFAGAFGDELHELLAMPVVELSSADRAPLDANQLQAIVVIPEDFADRLARNERTAVKILTREGDEISKLAARRLTDVLARYRRALKLARFARHGLPPEFDQVFAIRDPDESKPLIERTSNELRDLLVKFLPFMLVMWSMAGALYPAIDLCAGEKERGTMETLLISPSSRVEIVGGKYLAVWTLASVTALWNLLWIGGGALLGSALVQMPLVRPVGLIWCALFILPLAALFSGLCLALGVYARSTKEGQYYLLPIFLGTMPLVMLSLAPGIELTLPVSLIPVTGVCLLLQRAMLPTSDASAWWYLAPVLASLAITIALALWWAVVQFHREDVLFREGDRLDVGSWLKSLFRSKTR